MQLNSYKSSNGNLKFNGAKKRKFVDKQFDTRFEFMKFYTIIFIKNSSKIKYKYTNTYNVTPYRILLYEIEQLRTHICLVSKTFDLAYKLCVWYLLFFVMNKFMN